MPCLVVTFPVGTEKAVKEQGKLSVVKRHPKLCKRHNGEWYLDPGVPETADYILSLVKELVNGYDIDGIQFDYIRLSGAGKELSGIKRFIINMVNRRSCRTGGARTSTRWCTVSMTG